MQSQTLKNEHKNDRNIQNLKKKIDSTKPDSDVEDEEHIISKKIQIRQRSNPKSQRWCLQENKLYVKFLQQHAHLFRYKSVRRVRQIFILLSEKMNGRRTPAQCKSHHQKMRKATQKAYVKKKYINKFVNQPQPQILKIKAKKVNYSNGQDSQVKISSKQKPNNLQISIKFKLELVSLW